MAKTNTIALNGTKFLAKLGLTVTEVQSANNKEFVALVSDKFFAVKARVQPALGRVAQRGIFKDVHTRVHRVGNFGLLKYETDNRKARADRVVRITLVPIAN